MVKYMKTAFFWQHTTSHSEKALLPESMLHAAPRGALTHVHEPSWGPRAGGMRLCWRCSPGSTRWCGWPGGRRRLQSWTEREFFKILWSTFFFYFFILTNLKSNFLLLFEFLIDLIIVHMQLLQDMQSDISTHVYNMCWLSEGHEHFYLLTIPASLEPSSSSLLVLHKMHNRLLWTEVTKAYFFSLCLGTCCPAPLFPLPMMVLQMRFRWTRHVLCCGNTSRRTQENERTWGKVRQSKVG